jgi:CPA1 family monovalent cation:H+ antiporter
LINDASGLVIYRFAVLAAMANTFSASNALITFPTLIVVGVIVGALCGWFATWLFKWLDNVELTIVLTFLVSWASYICSESVHGSGVLAVVACGLVIGLRQHKVFDAEVRVKATATWGVLVFVLESLVFILIGLALRGAVVQMESHAGSDMSLALGWRMAGIVLAAVIVSRLVWVFGAMALPAWLFAKSTGSARRADFKGSALLGWAGMRGVVSLAAALALPESFPQRDLLIFTTFIVIFATVVFQGMTLGPLSKWLRLERSPAGARNKRLMSQFQARAHTFQASVDALRQIDLLHCGGNADLVGRLIDEYQIRAESNEAAHTGELAHLERRSGRLELGLKAVAAARGALVELHEQHRIRDDVLHRIEGELDLEEMRLRYLLAPSD